MTSKQSKHAGAKVPTMLILLSFLIIAVTGVALNNMPWHRHSSKPPTVELFQSLSKYSVPIQVPLGTIGSGVLVKLPSGYTAIITNDHVCAAAVAHDWKLQTTYKNRTVLDLAVQASSRNSDLCVINSPTLYPAPGITIGSNRGVTFGDQLLVIGYPLGGPMTPSTGYYVGLFTVILANNTLPDGTCPPDEKPTLTPVGIVCEESIRLHASTVVIYPGNSGSPVFDLDGELVGIMNSADMETHKGNYISADALAALVKGM